MEWSKWCLVWHRENIFRSKRNGSINCLNDCLIQLQKESSVVDNMISNHLIDMNVDLSQSSNYKKRKSSIVEENKKTHVTHPTLNNFKGRKRNISIGKFFHCDELSHWKKECPHFSANFNRDNKRGKYYWLVFESFIEVCDMSPRIVDIGVINYVCYSL